MKIEFEPINITKEEFDILADNKSVGTFRFYKNPDFKYNNTQLCNFLGYVSINKEYRRKGILRKIVEDFDIKSLMVDDVEDIPKDILTRIYKKLGFNFIEDSERFMIRK